MELSGNYFTYNGISSREYGMIFANANTSRNLALTGEIASVTVFNKRDKRNYLIGESYEESALVFEAEVITDDDHALDSTARREMEKWLFHQADYRKLYIDTTCNSSDGLDDTSETQAKLYLNCRFVNPEKLESVAGVVGYKFTIECDSAMAWQDTSPYIWMFGALGDPDNRGAEGVINTTVTVNVDTDIRDFVYPKVTITTGDAGGDIMISNLTDDPTRVTAFTGLTPNITFTMNGNGINYISGDNYLKFSNRNFIRLLDGENTLSLYGDISGLTIEFQNQRYL